MATFCTGGCGNVTTPANSTSSTQTSSHTTVEQTSSNIEKPTDIIESEGTMLPDNNPPQEILKDDPPFLPASDPNNVMNWKMSETFSDEFDAETLDTSKWITGVVSWVGRAPAYYVSENAYVEDGNLVLRSTWTGRVMEKNDGRAVVGDPIFDAASITSVLKSGYGYYEISSRTAPIGLTSAFWMRDGSGDELDVYEQVGRSKLNTSYNTIYPHNTHYLQQQADGSKKDISTPMKYDTGMDLTADFHVYGMEYGREFIKFYFNGKLVNTVANTEIHDPMNLRFDTEAFVWHGYPVESDFYTMDDGRFTGDYHVEYIRVWRTDETQLEGYPKDDSVAKLSISKYGTPANITDGVVDKLWDSANPLDGFNIALGGVEKISATSHVKTLWDEHHLYVLMEVIDPDVYKSPDINTPHNGDCIDIYIDLDNDKADSYDTNDYGIKILADGELIPHPNAPANIVVSGGLTEQGYTLQVAVPWRMEVFEDKVIGFDVQLNEANSADKERVAILCWNSTDGSGWKSMSSTGDLQLVK